MSNNIYRRIFLLFKMDKLYSSKKNKGGEKMIYDDNKFKTLANDIVFKSIFFKDDELLKWLMNRTFKSLNLNYSINNFNVRNGELVVDKVFLKSRALDVLIESDNIVYNLEVNSYFSKDTTLRNYLYQCNYLIILFLTVIVS